MRISDGSSDVCSSDLHKAVNDLSQQSRVPSVNPILWPPRPQVLQQRENITPSRPSPCKRLPALPATPQRPDFRQCPRVGHQQVCDGILVFVIRCQGFLVNQFQPLDPVDRRSERGDRATKFEDQQSLRRQRTRVGAQHQSLRVARQYLGQAFELWPEPFALPLRRKSLRFWNIARFSDSSISVVFWFDAQKRLAQIDRHLASPA